MEVTVDFKKMIDEDIENLKDALSDINNMWRRLFCYKTNIRGNS